MTTKALNDGHEQRLLALLEALIDQKACQVLVEPYDRSSGYWFGGGNITRDKDGALLIAGRYRNFGDSRTGVGAGTRGLELALFVSSDQGRSFTKTRHWSKADLSYPGNEVVSIEGVALHHTLDGRCELFVSSEKDRPYPGEVASFQKPGTGVWTIDLIHGESVADLDEATIAPVLRETPEPGYLHVKDPSVFDAANGDTVLLFCDHPFMWCSVNSGYAVRPKGAKEFKLASWEMVSRGPAWDLAGNRITNRMPVPRIGPFADLAPLSVFFYDGLECYRPLDENSTAVQRPRGYSCEEIGGAFHGFDDDFPYMTRLSKLLPLFTSPYGTGCSRYVDTLVDDSGVFAIWQQAQEDGSQPLVGHFLSMQDIKDILK